MIRYRSVRPDDSALRERLRGLAQERRRFGYTTRPPILMNCGPSPVQRHRSKVRWEISARNKEAHDPASPFLVGGPPEANAETDMRPEPRQPTLFD